MRRQAGCDGMMMTDWKISPCRPLAALQYCTRDSRNREDCRQECGPLVINMPETAYHAAHSNKSLPKVGVDYHRAVRKACSGSDLR